MKIKQITETTTSGSIATVDSALGGTQSRGNPSIYGGKKVGSLFKGKKTKAPYANSINESAELSEAQLEEDDVIVVPGQGRKSKTGFVPHGQSRVDHEVEMARSDLFSAAKNAQQVYSMIKDVSEDEGLDGWVQEKIIKANDYLNTIREYLEGKQVQSVNEGAEIMYAEELAEKVFEQSPNLQNEDDILTRGFQLAKKDPRISGRVNSIFRTEDFPSDFVSYYRYIQHNHGIRSGMNEGSQKVDTLVTDALKIMRGAEVSDAVRALTTVLGNREYNSRRGFYNFYIRQILDMYGQQGVTEGSRNAYLKHNNLVDLEKPLAGLKDEFNKFLRTHDPEEKQKFQQGIKQRIKTRPMAGPKGVLPEQGISEGAKVDRMVKHIEKSEEKSGKSKKEAENIAWATANKRGMLNNKNKKA
jgi:hypothetical protein